LAYSKTYHQLLESKEKGISYCKSNIYLAPELLKVSFYLYRNFKI